MSNKNKKILKPNFFKRDSKTIARELLGKVIISSSDAYLLITETEAYLGEDDKASHARFGETKRNEPMYMKGGIWYVYLIYGMYYMLNIVTGFKNNPSAVLIRGGIGYKRNREGNLIMVKEAKGPGILTNFLKVDLSYNGKIASRDSGLYIVDVGLEPKRVIRTPRIGVDYAEEWKDRKLRYVWDYNKDSHSIDLSNLDK